VVCTSISCLTVDVCVCVTCRQRVVLDELSDDEDVTVEDIDEQETPRKNHGCLPHRSRSANFDSLAHHDGEPATHHHSNLAEKILKFFRPPGSGRQSPTCHQPPQRQRRFMRVVKDEHAPPPERVGDNPNIICRYSQEFLTKHYAEVEREQRLDRSRTPVALPYCTSGHTILKKSSTDPTSDRCTGPPTTLKHATFCDVVIVVDSEDGQVHEERLHETEPSNDFSSEEGSPPQSGFFLSHHHAELDSVPADEVEGPTPSNTCQADSKDEVVEESGPKDVSSGLLNIFSTAVIPEPDMPETQSVEEPKRKISGSLPPTKHVKLVELMAQMRVDDGERS